MESTPPCSEILEARGRSAEFLFTNRDKIGKGDELTDTRHVLNFFQTIANLAIREALDKEFVADEFGLWMKTYWHFAEQHLRAEVRSNNLAWLDLRNLIDEFDRKYGAPSDEKLLDYLNRERARGRVLGSP